MNDPQRGARADLVFDEDGKLLYGVLAQDTAIQGFKFKSGTEVWFHPSGKLAYGTLVGDTAIDGVEYKGGEAHFGAVLDGVETPRGCATRFNISFHENAKVYSGELARDATIDGITYKQGTAIRLRDNGKVYQGVLAAKTTIRGISFMAGAREEPDALIVVGRPDLPLFLSSQPYEAPEKVHTPGHAKNILEIQNGSDRPRITFHADGAVRTGSLAADTVIAGVKYKAGTQIDFDEGGKAHAPS